MLQPMADAGHFEAGELAPLLHRLHDTRAGGRLQVDSGDLSCSLVLVDGDVAAIAADSERYRLGQWLVARGVIEAEPMALALLRQPDGTPFGEHLVAEGLLTRDALHEELQLRAAAMVGLLLFSSGEYKVEPDAGARQQALAIDLSTTALLMAASRECDGDRLSDLVAGSSEYLRASAEVLERARGAMLRPEEAFLLSRLDRTTSTADLRHIVPMPEGELRRILAALVIAGLAELRGAPDLARAATNVEKASALGGARPPQPTPAPAGKTDGSPLALGSVARYGADQEKERSEIRRVAAEVASRDYYRRLGVTRGATLDQIHSSYRDQIRLFDPERASLPHLAALRPELEKIHEALVEAYRTVGDPRRRSSYDAFLRSAGSGGGERQFATHGQEIEARRSLVEANRKRAQELIRLGQIGEAVQLLDQVVRLEPVAEELLQLARLELKNPMWAQRALDHLKAALDLDPRLTDAWRELARFWERRKKTAKQRECLRKILEYDPDNESVQDALIALRVE